MMRRILVPGLAGLLLAACAAPGPKPTMPVPMPAPALPKPAPPPPPAAAPSAEAPLDDIWSRMRERFAMPACPAEPSVQHWARRFTHNRSGFERQIRRMLPTIAYVEQQAEQASVPAEFALLPWVESRYRAVPPRRGRPAGMWQIMPITARALDLSVRHDYDARLDRVAATVAVMGLLHRYHRRWHDWRLVDMAYNAGEYRLRRLQSEGEAPADPILPSLAVSATTREHLAKLLAIACVIREPQRFGVRLPALGAEQQLRAVALEGPLDLREAARRAGMPLAAVRELNGGYLRRTMSRHGPWRLLLPAFAADRFVHTPPSAEALQAQADIQADTYTVGHGDTLWQIARDHDTSVARLLALNHLDSAVVHPGQVLRIREDN